MHHKPAIVEALTLRGAIIICNDLELEHVIFEGDCKRVVDAIISSLENSTELSPLIFYVKSIFRHHSSWEVKFAYRDTSRVAHSLAKLACSFSGENVWLKECPMQVMSLILKDKHCNVT